MAGTEDVPCRLRGRVGPLPHNPQLLRDLRRSPCRLPLAAGDLRSTGAASFSRQLDACPDRSDNRAAAVHLTSRPASKYQPERNNWPYIALRSTSDTALEYDSQSMTNRGGLRARASHGQFTRAIEQVDIDREAARLYQQFSSYSEVARIQGCPVSTARDRVMRALAGEPDDDTALAKKVALARLNAQAIIAQRIAESEFVAHSNGRVVYLGETPLVDVGPNLAALDRLQRIEDQRNRILGIYAPTAARIEVVPADVIERMIVENEALIRAAERELGLAPSTAGLPEAASEQD